MSGYIPAVLARLVRRRALDVCEYCGLPQASQEAAFHIDHIEPRTAGGPTSEENLALACVTCSLKKAGRTHARDSQTQRIVPLFHPRRDRWSDHFRRSANGRLLGRTPTGRATIVALGMNRPAVVVLRRLLAALGEM
jgi:5-methylcytosine-specific restriction endonuclease McrA